MDLTGCFLDGEPPGNGNGGACQNVGFYATRNTNQTLPPTVETTINWNVLSPDTTPAGVFSLTSDQFIAPVEGRYTFSCAVKINTAAAGSAYLRLYRNNTIFLTEAGCFSTIANVLSPCVSVIIWLAQNDTIDARVMQNTGFNATLQGCGNQFSGALICGV